MRCPQCRRPLRRRQDIAARRCAVCGRRWALDRRDPPYRLSPRRLRETARRLSHDGLLRFTTEQLFYALQPPSAPSRVTPRRPPPRPSVARNLRHLGWVLAGAAALVPLGLLTRRLNDAGHEAAGLTLAIALVIGLYACAGLLVVGLGHTAAAFLWRRHRLPPYAPGGDRSHARAIRRLRRHVVWFARVNGGLPGLCDRPPRPEWAVPPVLAVACPSRAVRACLYANGVPVEVVDRPGDAPQGIPVAQLHDLAASTRVAAHRHGWPDLTPAAGPWLRWYRRRTPPERLRLALRDLPDLPHHVREPLDAGWYAPVDALPPAVLIRLVERHRRAVAARDPDHRAAQDLGFLDHPGANVEA
ncbi:hypothetical protein Val02_61860 [Virgisporangium aliadipatigenens]|uniref:Uncharacterized protein n=1 Tax=Virgisporangium aliadipatigenens TaxID=741659 RepID=A0A8J4DSJ4_9ACTN|nr:hypothetical protein [Virgisporangium aliadipatigenens]GIJ49300.1 hypothetical protein Val02_61860 [Virgisporangium aliadipatigenens]